MQARISISALVFQAMQLAFLAGVQPVCELAELCRLCAASKGKRKWSTRLFCIPTDCVFAQPCYCCDSLRRLACPLSSQLQATDLPPCFGLLMQLYCMSLVIFCVHILSSRALRPPAGNSDITFCSLCFISLCLTLPVLVVVCIFSIMKCIYFPSKFSCFVYLDVSTEKKTLVFVLNTNVLHICSSWHGQRCVHWLRLV